MKNQCFVHRLSYPAGGIRAAFRTEASFRTQLPAVLVASIAAVLIGIPTLAVGPHPLDKT